MDARAEAPLGTCEDAAELAVLPSPVAPWKGAPLRVVFAAEKPLEGELSLIAPDGSVAAKSRERRGGPPYFWFAEVASPAVGTWQAQLARDRAPAECSTITREIAVRAVEPPRPRATEGSLWPLRDTWNCGTENLYSAWIETLFDAPVDAAPSWRALHEVLRDRSRNFLFNHLGLGEDAMGLVIRPDCADLPVFPARVFRVQDGAAVRVLEVHRAAAAASRPGATRGGTFSTRNLARLARAKKPCRTPRVGEPVTVGPAGSCSGRADLRSGRRGSLRRSADYLGTTVADGVHSGSGRTRASDDNTDYYPVPLSEETLRPGTVYADPYGHLLVLARRVSQTDGAAGVFLAVDGQPDGTVARKRFWRGNFLFAQDPALGSPGFKRFRPIVRERNGALRRLTNDEIAKDPQYGDFSLDQSRLGVEAFYDRMEDVMSPAPLDPLRAMKEAITALEEQVKTRVTSVENGRKFQSSGRGEAEMPDGAAIFETTGAWEDFATPSRDLRLLIAMDVVRGFPDRVARRPERYAMPKERVSRT